MIQSFIKDLPNDQKPRERLISNGSGTLSDAELLAIVLNTGGKNVSALGLAHNLLREYKNLTAILSAPINHLQLNQNVGIKKAVTLKAVLEICNRVNINEPKIDKYIRKPNDVFEVLKPDLRFKDKELLILLSLDTRRKIISKDILTIGTINETLVPVREILRTALLNNSVNIVLAHNHPSEDPTPSEEDILVTHKLYKACEYAGINLLDHVIITSHEYVSIQSLGLMKGGE